MACHLPGTQEILPSTHFLIKISPLEVHTLRFSHSSTLSQYPYSCVHSCRGMFVFWWQVGFLNSERVKVSIHLLGKKHIVLEVDNRTKLGSVVKMWFCNASLVNEGYQLKSEGL